MIDRSEAEEHLRVIRSLMEKATVYRAISAPAALIGGILSLLAASAGVWLSNPAFAVPHEACRFALPWGLVLAATAVANLVLLRRERNEGELGFVSARMVHTLRGMSPALLGGGFATALQSDGGWATTASLWVLFYGISLLAASHFAPSSIRWLGRAFFAAGAALLTAKALALDACLGSNHDLAAHAVMGSTFGLFHLIYAACTWPRRAR
ncbi:MAG: hypothetical protein ABMA13_06545 [Chthoniobacteraceae bacterium]